MKRYKSIKQQYIEQRGQGMRIGNPAQQDGGADYCECPECGYREKHERGFPCAEKMCPKCNVKMIGVNE
jgi:hypothetical protein